MPLKRYIALFGHTWYPSEGMQDFVADFDSLEEGIACLEAELVKDPCTSPSGYEDVLLAKWEERWGIVWDSETRVEVWNNGEPVEELKSA